MSIFTRRGGTPNIVSEPPVVEPPVLFSLDEAARMLRFWKREAIEHAIARREISAIDVGGLIRIPQDEVERLANEELIEIRAVRACAARKATVWKEVPEASLIRRTEKLWSHAETDVLYTERGGDVFQSDGRVVPQVGDVQGLVFFVREGDDQVVVLAPFGERNVPPRDYRFLEPPKPITWSDHCRARKAERPTPPNEVEMQTALTTEERTQQCIAAARACPSWTELDPDRLVKQENRYWVDPETDECFRTYPGAWFAKGRVVATLNRLAFFVEDDRYITVLEPLKPWSEIISQRELLQARRAHAQRVRGRQ